jgi:hypothetical protein
VLRSASPVFVEVVILKGLKVSVFSYTFRTGDFKGFSGIEETAAASVQGPFLKKYKQSI